MRSVVVVLPASMWAMIPMLRSFSSGIVLGISGQFGKSGRSTASSLVEKKNSPARRCSQRTPGEGRRAVQPEPRGNDRSALEPNEEDSKGMTSENRPPALAERLSGGLERARPLLRRARGAWRPGWLAGALAVLLALSA